MVSSIRMPDVCQCKVTYTLRDQTQIFTLGWLFFKVITFAIFDFRSWQSESVSLVASLRADAQANLAFWSSKGPTFICSEFFLDDTVSHLACNHSLTPSDGLLQDLVTPSAWCNWLISEGAGWWVLWMDCHTLAVKDNALEVDFLCWHPFNCHIQGTRLEISLKLPRQDSTAVHYVTRSSAKEFTGKCKVTRFNILKLTCRFTLKLMSVQLKNYGCIPLL